MKPSGTSKQRIKMWKPKSPKHETKLRLRKLIQIKCVGQIFTYMHKYMLLLHKWDMSESEADN